MGIRPKELENGPGEQGLDQWEQVLLGQGEKRDLVGQEKGD